VVARGVLTPWAVAIEKRLAQLAVAAEKLIIMKNARGPVGISGRLPLTIKQVEAKIAALLMAPDTQSNRNKIYSYTKMLRHKRVECIFKAQKLAALNEHKRLTAAQYKEVPTGTGRSRLYRPQLRTVWWSGTRMIGLIIGVLLVIIAADALYSRALLPRSESKHPSPN
jgi:hypothetical protein